MHGLAAALEADGPQPVVSLTGEIDLDNADDVRTLGLMAVNAELGSIVEFDMSAVTFIDSTGVAALIEIYNAGESAGVVVRIGAASAPVTRVFVLCGLAEMFGIVS